MGLGNYHLGCAHFSPASTEEQLILSVKVKCLISGFNVMKWTYTCFATRAQISFARDPKNVHK